MLCQPHMLFQDLLTAAFSLQQLPMLCSWGTGALTIFFILPEFSASFLQPGAAPSNDCSLAVLLSLLTPEILLAYSLACSFFLVLKTLFLYKYRIKLALCQYVSPCKYPDRHLFKYIKRYYLLSFISRVPPGSRIHFFFTRTHFHPGLLNMLPVMIMAKRKGSENLRIQNL